MFPTVRYYPERGGNKFNKQITAWSAEMKKGIFISFHRFR